MKVRSIVIFIICIFCFTFASKQNKQKKTGSFGVKVNDNKVFKTENEYGIYELKNGTGVFISKSANFEVTIKKNKKKGLYLIKMKGKTEGWISVGFGRSKVMKDSEIVMAGVAQGDPYITHHYGTGIYRHKKINRLDKKAKKDIVKLISAKEENGYTIVSFTRVLASKGKYYKKLKSGQIIELLYAFAPNDKDRRKHNERGFIKIKLP